MRFRNALSHSRSMTEVDLQDGRAALIWFRNVMSPTNDDSSQYTDAVDNPESDQSEHWKTEFKPEIFGLPHGMKPIDHFNVV